jgi:hypothetical protein
MNIFEKLRILKALFNGKHIFYYAHGKWHFETCISKENTKDIELIKKYAVKK